MDGLSSLRLILYCPSTLERFLISNLVTAASPDILIHISLNFVNQPPQTSVLFPKTPYTNQDITWPDIAPNFSKIFQSARHLKMKIISISLALAVLASTVNAGPAAYGVCQAGCAAVVMACYGAAGLTWGATAGALAPASALACNAAFGKCQAACALIALSPTP